MQKLLQKPAQKFVTALLLVCVGVPSLAYSALTLSADEEIRREEIAGICMIASNGVYNIATDHQNGVKKDKAKKNLDKELKKIDKSFKNKDLVAFVDETWHQGLDIIYKMPVHDNKADKEKFIEQALDGSFRACFDDLDR